VSTEDRLLPYTLVPHACIAVKLP